MASVLTPYLTKEFRDERALMNAYAKASGATAWISDRAGFVQFFAVQKNGRRIVIRQGAYAEILADAGEFFLFKAMGH